MTWILAADAGELTEDEAQELAAEQRAIATAQRNQGRHYANGRLHRLYISAQVYLATVWPC